MLGSSTHPPKSTHAFIQPGREYTVDITKDRIGLFAIQLLAQELDNRFEFL